MTFPPRIQAVVISDKVSPQLPKLPMVHKSMIAGSSDSAESLISKNTISKSSQARPINLDKLVIRQVQTSFPFLKRLKSPTENTLESANNNQAGEINNYQLPVQPLIEINQSQNQELIKVNVLENSPLIQQWMAQEYLLDQGTELVYQDQDHEQDYEEDYEEDYEQNHEQDYEQDYEQFIQEDVINTNDDEAEENITVAKLINDLNLHLNADLESETNPVSDLSESLVLDNTETDPTPEVSQSIHTDRSEEIVLDEYLIDQQEEQTTAVESENLSSPEWEFLPTPQLFLPNEELIAGTAVKVRLEMQTASSSVVIKLWVEDYQTRILLDGPHLLQDLRPTPWGSWEATTRILVPLGCVEILLGAIALDLESQQESHKVTMVRTIIPADLSTIEVDELLDL
ncbi:MAG: hypothetical protein F6K62_17155 [Sphaerospermopsis sp. SIO1G2]|nr:hypothetical protein [Sphaerospermopsis sp. SIO1G2]